MKLPGTRAARGLLLTTILTSSLALQGDVRKWTDQQGRIVEAEFVKFEDGIVHFRMKNGKIGKVALEKLSGDDQAFVKKAVQPTPSIAKPNADSPKPSEEKWPNFHGAEPPTPFGDWVYPKGTAARIYIEEPEFFSPDGDLLFDGVDFVGNDIRFHHGFATIKFKNADNSWSPALMDAEGKFILGGKGGAPLPEGTKVLGKYGGDGLIAFGVETANKKGNGKHNWGYLDLEGKVVLEPKWSFAHPFVNGLAPVSVGETTIENHPAGGAARFTMGGSYHYIDKTGAKAIDGDWKIALPFDGFGHAFVLPKSDVPKTLVPWLSIDKKGNLSSPSSLLTGKWTYRDERIVIKNQILDLKGSVLFSAAKGTLRDCEDGSGVCIYQCGYERGKQSNYRLVDRASGKCYGPELEYKFLKPFKEGHGIFETHDRKGGLIDRTGKIIFGPHAGHGRLDNGYYIVTDPGRNIVEYWSIKTRKIFKTKKP